MNAIGHWEQSIDPLDDVAIGHPHANVDDFVARVGTVNAALTLEKSCEPCDLI